MSKFVSFGERHGQPPANDTCLSPVVLLIDSIWQRQEAQLQADHDAYEQRLDETMKRVEDAIESYRAIQRGDAK